MLPKHRVFVVSVAAMAGLVCAAAGYAQTARRPARPAAPAAEARAQRQPGAGPVAGLNLTQEQRDQIKALREAQAGDVRALREKMRAARHQLRAALQADVLDEAAVRAAAEAVGALQADQIVRHARARAEFLKVLTPEQQAQLKQARARAAQRAARAAGARRQMWQRQGAWRQSLRWWRGWI